RAGRRSLFRLPWTTCRPPRRCCEAARAQALQSGWRKSAATAKWWRSSSATAAAEARAVPRIPGLGWYALAGAVFIAGLALGGILVWTFIAGFEPAVRFLAPGAVQVSIAVPGDQIIWHEHHTLYQGRAFNVAPVMPDGTRYRAQAPDGSTITIEPHSGTRSE